MVKEGIKNAKEEYPTQIENGQKFTYECLDGYDNMYTTRTCRLGRLDPCPCSEHLDCLPS